MAKIKSTMDLIMERTGHLSLNDQERKDLRWEEQVRRARGIVVPYLSGERDLNALVRDLERLPEKEREDVRDRCLEILREPLDPLADNERALRGLERVGGADERLLWEERIRQAKDAYEVERCGRQAVIAEQVRESLRSEAGLSGPALVPCMESSGLWKEEVSRVRRAFRERFPAAPPEQRH